jgi:hypothetical protein
MTFVYLLKEYLIIKIDVIKLKLRRLNHYLYLILNGYKLKRSCLDKWKNDKLV